MGGGDKKGGLRALASIKGVQRKNGIRPRISVHKQSHLEYIQTSWGGRGSMTTGRSDIGLEARLTDYERCCLCFLDSSLGLLR